jgi:hypothetical protein
VEVFWPSGSRETFPVTGVDRIVKLVEGDGLEEKPVDGKITAED